MTKLTLADTAITTVKNGSGENSVIVLLGNNVEVDVDLINLKYRRDLGCKISVNDYDDAYILYDKDLIDAIVIAAEDYAYTQNQLRYKDIYIGTLHGQTVYLRQNCQKETVQLIAETPDNLCPSLRVLEYFLDIKEAKKHIKRFYTAAHPNFGELNNLLKFYE